MKDILRVIQADSEWIVSEAAKPRGQVNLDSIRQKADAISAAAATLLAAPDPQGPDPVDCVLSDWSAWEPDGEWSACVDGQQARAEVRWRTVVTEPAHGGAACGPLTEMRVVTRECVVDPGDPDDPDDPDPVEPEPLTISTTTLPAGEVGRPYSRTLLATGGVTPHTWSVSDGALPAGLTLSTAGLVHGVPTAKGSSSVTVRVTDAQSTTATQTYQITIAEASSGAPDDYFTQLAARPEAVAAFSLRDIADLRALQAAFGNGVWDYVYPDADYPDGPDAARCTLSGSLVGRNQLILGHQVNDGRYVWVIDVYWTPEMQAHIKEPRTKGNVNHKMLNMRDPGGIYFEPGHVYGNNMAPGEIGVHKVRLYSGGLGAARPAGFIRDAPMTPPGRGATVVWPDDSPAFRTVENTWHRFIIEVDLDQPGSLFTEWSEDYNGGKPISTWDIVSTEPGDEAGTTRVRLAQEHQLYFLEKAKRTGVSRVTISGHSNPALNGVWPAKPDPEDLTSFSVPVAAAGGTGGTTSMHYNRLSWWVLDENRDAVRVLYRVPWVIRENFQTGQDWRTADSRPAITRWDVELNTSSSFQDHAAGWYMQTAPTVEQQTVITTPEPHDYRVGDRLAFRFSDVIPVPSDKHNSIFRVIEVVSSTQVRIDWAVTRASVPELSGPGAGTYGYVAKVFRCYWRNWVLLKDVALDEADATIFARPVR